MDVAGLRSLLHAALVDLERGNPVDGDALASLVDRIPGIAEGASQEDLRGLLEDLQALAAAAQEAQSELGVLLEEIAKGRRGNRGYHSLKAFRKAQRLYRRA